MQAAEGGWAPGDGHRSVEEAEDLRYIWDSELPSHFAAVQWTLGGWGVVVLFVHSWLGVAGYRLTAVMDSSQGLQPSPGFFPSGRCLLFHR